jgi:2-polyprenyl-3-methyl-5-hydroxy-6-metoxy-1,4-benzoquinol methylase
MGMSATEGLARFVTRDRCITCASSNLAVLDSGNFREGLVHDLIAGSPHGEDPLPSLAQAEWILQRCGDCSQIFHRNMLDADWMDIAYSRWASVEAIEQFERQFGADTFAWKYAAARQRFRHVLRLERLTRALRGNDAVRLLDFGCGKGEFVEACIENGFDAVGVDFSTSRMASARLRIVPTLEDVSGAFHVVALFEVLEHVERPADILTMLSERLVDDGILVVETPDCSGVTGIRSPRDRHLVDPIQHVNAFTPRTLTAIVERAGFKRIRRPMAVAAAGATPVARTIAAYLFRRGERGTQQYFRKVPTGADPQAHRPSFGT